MPARSSSWTPAVYAGEQAAGRATQPPRSPFVQKILRSTYLRAGRRPGAPKWVLRQGAAEVLWRRGG